MVVREEGTHTFAATGHRRLDRVVDGERTTTEIVVPPTTDAGSQIVIDYGLGVVRTGPLNVATSAHLRGDRLSATPASLLPVAIAPT